MNKVMPNVNGVSRPSGIAVTSLRPVLFASRKAEKKKARSPTSTPSAVPGTIDETAKSVGKPKLVSNVTIKINPAMLSNIKPKNALTSPACAQR